MRRHSGLKYLVFLVMIGIFIYSCIGTRTVSKNDSLNDFFLKKDVKIAVVDSGLGGLSILAETLNQIKKNGIFSHVEFIFYNALFSSSGGYNALPSDKEKTEIFNSALSHLAMKYSPDLILIGCNTLSVLLKNTAFYSTTTIPVIGILDAGVELIAGKLKSYPESEVLIFGTQTTILQDSHRERLLEKGFLPERIHTQACPELESFIEKDRTGEDTEMLIFAYLDEAIQRIGRFPHALFISLNCTHYGYSLQLWGKALKELKIESAEIINPNLRMIDDLFRSVQKGRFKQVSISVSVVSMVEIGEDQMRSIGGW
ncbi:MAG: aspartate/glutamate racemase family protein, partial [Candidatus Aminicenantes bacterium]|nr:aspartate/glutamate racemase family protein [Candidatus Aminicenantes bacterium]